MTDSAVLSFGLVVVRVTATTGGEKPSKRYIRPNNSCDTVKLQAFQDAAIIQVISEAT